MEAASEAGSNEQLTVLLQRMRGDERAAGEVASQLYGELKRQARALLKSEGKQHSLQPTLLVNEAFVRLLGGQQIDWQSRKHFFLVSARMMRRIIADYYRARGAQKRPSSGTQIEIDEMLAVTEERREEILAVDQALERLQRFDPRAAQVVELRYFAGRTDEEIAGLLGVTMRTVRRDWMAARIWLKQQFALAGNAGE